MNRQGKFYVLGAGWISAYGYGFFGSAPQFSNSDVNFQYPPLEEYIHELPGRFGRFDVYTKISFTAAVLALKDAGWLSRSQGTEEKRNIGIVVGSSSGVYDDDLAFFESTRDSGGEFASPNLFSYTLPNVALGEIAVFFKFIGPTFCVGNDYENPGSTAIPSAASLLASNQCECVLAGWVEAAQNIKNHEKFSKGAAFAVLSREKNEKSKGDFSFHDHFNFSKLFGG
jgi:3-oxoacyl-(acyl-carrier-protein) synthase